MDRGCMDNVFTLSSIIQIKLKEKNGKLFALFVDFKAAFPSIYHDILWNKLGEIGISTKIVRILRDIYGKATVAIKNNMGCTNYVKVTNGLLQGEPTSPILFALFIADLETFMRNNGVEGVSINHLIDIIFTEARSRHLYVAC